MNGKWLAVGGLGFALIAVVYLDRPPASGAQAPVATLTLMEGDVKVDRDGKVLGGAEGLPLQDKDKVMTGRGRAEVRFRDGTTIRTRELTHVRIVEGLKEGGGLIRSIELTLGSLWFKVIKVTQVADARTEFLTPTAVAAVRGTEGEIQVANDGHSKFALTEGALDVRNKSGVGRPERLAAYQMVEVAHRKPPTMPVPYLGPPPPAVRGLVPGEHGRGPEARATGAPGVTHMGPGVGHAGSNAGHAAGALQGRRGDGSAVRSGSGEGQGQSANVWGPEGRRAAEAGGGEGTSPHGGPGGENDRPAPHLGRRGHR